VDDVLSYVRQKTQSVHRELTQKINITQVDLQATRTSINMWTKSLLDTITDQREHLHEELQAETQTMKALIEAT
jgi:hypothetical protein